MVGNIIAFRRYKGGSNIFGEYWVGFRYFKQFIGDGEFWNAFWNTLRLSIGYLLVRFPATLIFALLINEIKNLKWKKTVQTISYLPHFISLVVVCGLVKELLSTAGPINSMIAALGFEKIPFMSEPGCFDGVYIISGVWQALGWGTILYLTAMTNINTELYEAALPGMWESAAGGYSLVIRKDVFEAAGVDVAEAEKTWTWEDFYDACMKVKEYTGADYVWSDQYQLGCAMNLSAAVYGVKGGNSKDGGDWGLQNGMVFDFDENKFQFADTTDKYKEYLTFWNKMFADGVMDPETFTQDSDQAQAKFFRGESYVLTCNYQQLADMEANNKMQVDADLYFVVTPGGPLGQLQIESSRLENGIMISKSALDELGEDEFIKMLRFIDWLWYSDEGQTLSLWGVEGETYTKADDGTITLNSDIYYNGINPGAEKQLNVDYGFGGGVFAYGGSTELRFSKFGEGEKDWNERILANKELRKIAPPILSNEEEKEEMNLIQVPLMDYVNTAALEFITGKRDLNTDWDAYVADCESKGSKKYEDMSNEIYERTKDLLGE